MEDREDDLECKSANLFVGGEGGEPWSFVAEECVEVGDISFGCVGGKDFVEGVVGTTGKEGGGGNTRYYLAT